MMGQSKRLTANSRMKLIPTKPVSIYFVVDSKPSPCAHPVIVGIKKIRQPRRKIPVFTMGQVTAAAAVARYLFFFSKVLYIRPESVPARMPLTRTVATVPKAFTVMRQHLPKEAR